MMAKTRTSSKKRSRKARREAVARGESIPQPKRPAGGPRPRAAEPAPISTDVPTPERPQTVPGSVRVRFSDTSRSRTDTGIDERLSDIELPAIRKDLRKLAVTFTVFGVIFAGLAVIGTQTDLVQQLGEKLFTLWQ
jgi:hypothetical protein